MRKKRKRRKSRKRMRSLTLFNLTYDPQQNFINVTGPHSLEKEPQVQYPESLQELRLNPHL